MLKISKKEALPRKKQITIQVTAILLSLLFAGIFILCLGYNPLEVYFKIILGSVGSEIRLQQTIMRAVPLIITSMGILIAFKMKFWNIGGEGQIMMGAFGAALVGLNVGPNLPAIIVLPLMFIAGAICGAIWAAIPAFFKAKFGTNETIFTLMLNYIAIKFVTYLQYGPWKDPAASGFPRIPQFYDNGILPKLFGIHIGWVIAIVVVVLVYYFINNTKKGYEITVVGESFETARYAGMNIKAIIIVAMIGSGGLCGIAGVIQASGVENSLTYGLSAGIGFTAIITVWLGKLNPPMVAVVCVLFAMLVQGGNYVEIAMSVPAAVASMIQGVILFFVLGSEFFIEYKVTYKDKELGFNLGKKERGAN